MVESFDTNTHAKGGRCSFRLKGGGVQSFNRADITDGRQELSAPATRYLNHFKVKDVLCCIGEKRTKAGFLLSTPV